MDGMFRLLAKAGFGIDDRRAGPDGGPMQVGALPYRIDDGRAIRILLITSRRSGRWIVPKGWPVRGLNFAEAAAKEAFEEAGVRGQAGPAIGTIPAGQDSRGGISASILMHPLRVERELSNWPEKRQRRRIWLSQADAADRVASPDLAAMILTFDPPPIETIANDSGHDPVRDRGRW
jgi:8-oxo-dGTP pyrophosphatase MutT (NUDIX family)